jgi:hypothetical protein
MNWKTEVTEISNNVYKLIMIHELGVRIEKTGTDIEEMKAEALRDSIFMEQEMDKKLKNTNPNTM